MADAQQVNDEVANDIADLIDMSGGEEPLEGAVDTGEPSAPVEAASVAEPQVEATEAEPVAVTEPTTETEAEPAVAEPAIDELAQAKAETEFWRNKSNEIAAGQLGVQPAPKEAAEANPLEAKIEALSKQVAGLSAPASPGTPEDTLGNEVAYVGDEEAFAAALSGQQAFNTVLNSVASRAVEQALSKIPKVVTSQVNHQLELAMEVEDFWSTNPDLAPFKHVVAFAAQRLAAENPDWSRQKLFSEAAQVSRPQIKAHEGAKAPTPPVEPVPALVGATASRKPAVAQKVVGLESEIGELLEGMGRWVG